MKNPLTLFIYCASITISSVLLSSCASSPPAETPDRAVESMKDVYAKLNQQRDTANLEFHNNTQAALTEFESISK